jgi:hypothetical protein
MPVLRKATCHSSFSLILGGPICALHAATLPNLICCFMRGAFVGIHGKDPSGASTAYCTPLVALTIIFITTSRPALVMTFAGLGTRIYASLAVSCFAGHLPSEWKD